MSKLELDLEGWELLSHGGLLVDAPRLRSLADVQPEDLSYYLIEDLRRRYISFTEDRKRVGDWVTWVLEKICGFGNDTGYWLRGVSISTEWSRTILTGEVVRPRQLWRGSPAGLLPVFVDETNDAIGKGRGRKAVSNVLQWMRASNHRLALLTNGRQWRLLYAGLDSEAWCEWDAERWFEEGQIGKQLHVLRLFLSPKKWSSSSNEQPCELLQAVMDSRKGQSDLSALLGERVREAVEMLVQAHGEPLKNICAEVGPSDIYRAAVRIVMRMVVILFAESRDLLPRSNSIYHRAYSLNGLFEDLEKHGGPKGERIAHLYGAWPRTLALFRLVFCGSSHPSLPLHAYGGELFELGDPGSNDGLKRALAVFETACYEYQVMNDREVRLLLERISRTKVKLRQGRGATWVNMPVNFADLSSEYIGILYEGLLDFELKIAPENDPIIFLAVGKEPALPLSRLEAMDDSQLKTLLEKMKDNSKKDESDDEEDITDEFEEDDNMDKAEGMGESVVEADEDPEDELDTRQSTRTRAEHWANRVVQVTGLVRKPKGKLSPEKQFEFEQEITRKSKALVRRVILPGEWFLVRWGGTRKGAGSFYTRPGLAVPTVHRTLRPLAYIPPTGTDGQPNMLAPAVEWSPRKPEEILQLKVCDPACGSGSFPVAALRFLTEALFVSLHHYGRIQEQGDDRAFVALFGPEHTSAESLDAEMIPCRPEDGTFEPRLKARLRRHVVERCIYGVDLDPLATELCRLALWVETMDRNLPFSFLDHKIKCGNGLVGAWFDQFQHYPVMAWKNRDAGDKNHTNGVHYEKEARTKAIKTWVKQVLTPDLYTFLQGRTLFSENLHEQATSIHDEALSVLARLHSLPVHDSAERAHLYRTELLGNAAYQRLKQAMDLWCACWFWPADSLDKAPLPTTFAAPPEPTIEVAQRIASLKRFFHWELEFPDVFCSAGDGFSAIIGNPPWETAKPSSKEFFSNIDPLYRTYGKQEALRKQTDYFYSEDVEDEWLSYSADYRAQSNFVGYACNAYGDPQDSEINNDRFNIVRGRNNEQVHNRWRIARRRTTGYSDNSHGYRYQGSGDVNLYKLFLEQAHVLLCKGGRMGFIVPSGIYSDFGSAPLRKLFLDHCIWEWLFGFENRLKIFSIDSRFKFNPVIVRKGGQTKAINTAFMRRRLEDWERAEELAISYHRTQVEKFSPLSLAILEIQGEQDLEILEKLYANSVLLGTEEPSGWGVKYASEFHMTNDSKLFSPLPKWEEKGYFPDEYSRWVFGKWKPIQELWRILGINISNNANILVAQPPYDSLPIPRANIPQGIILSRSANEWISEEDIKDIALPLYEGRMIGQLDFSQKAWMSGKGRSADWQDIDWFNKNIKPQYLMAKAVCEENPINGLKLPIMSIGSATNSRTLISGLIYDFPCGNSLNSIRTKNDDSTFALSLVLNSFTVDFQMRMRLGGLNLNFFVLNELATLYPSPDLINRLNRLAISLGLANQIFSPYWLLQKSERGNNPWKRQWALSEYERLRIRAIGDSLVAVYAGLFFSDFVHILKQADIPKGDFNSELFSKGFWRIDKEKDPELRQTILTLVAFYDLQQKIDAHKGDREKGIEAFLSQNGGEGWMIPETLRLADFGLGKDQRALEHQPVANLFGPRFYDWQLSQTPEEGWRECHLHARNLLGEQGYRQLLERIEIEKHGGVYQQPIVEGLQIVNEKRKDDSQLKLNI